MPYTPPAGDAGDISWIGASSYTPPAGDAGNATFQSGALQTIAPGSIHSTERFGNAQALSLLQTIAPGSIRATERFGNSQSINLLQIVQPGSTRSSERFGSAAVFEPSYSAEATLETVIEANEYSVEVTLVTLIQSLSYSVEAVLETVIEPNEYSVEATLQTIIESPPYSVEATLQTIIFDRGVLDGDWLPVIRIDGVEISRDRYVGAVRITASRSVSRTAQFTYVLDAAEAAAYNVLYFHRKPVTIDALSGSQVIRRFTGQVQVPQFDEKSRLVTLNCADFLEESLMRLSLANAAGFAPASNWSEVVFGEAPATASEYLDQLLEINPISVQCDAYGLLHATPWIPAAPAVTLTSDDVEVGSQVVSLADTKQIVNRYEVELTTRGAACYGSIQRINYSLGQSLTTPAGFVGPKWAYVVHLGGSLMQRGMIEQALDSTGWRRMGALSYVAPEPTVYTSPGGTDVQFTVTPSVAEQLAVEFTENLRLEWGQTVEVKDKIVVAWNASIATYGELVEQERYLADTDFDVQAWESSKRATTPEETSVPLGWGGAYKDADGTQTGGGEVTGKGFGAGPHIGQGVTIQAGKSGLGWDYSTQAIACIVARCQNEILRSALSNTLSLNLMRIAPGLEIGSGITPGSGLSISSEAPLGISGFSDVWDFDNLDFYTELELQFIPVTATATEYSSSPQALPVPTFADGYNPSSGASPFATTGPVTYYGESAEGEQRMEITMPAIPDAYRETETQDRTASPLNHGVWWSANNLTIDAPERN
jgi:hypothetical protein